MNKKEQQKAQRAREEDIVLTKVLWWILGAVVLEALLLLLNKVYVNFTTEQVYIAVALQGMFNVLSIVLPICFVVLLIWTLVFWRAGRSLCLPGVLTGISLVLAVCAVVIHYFYDKGINFLYIAVPAVALFIPAMIAAFFIDKMRHDNQLYAYQSVEAYLAGEDPEVGCRYNQRAGRHWVARRVAQTVLAVIVGLCCGWGAAGIILRLVEG